MSFIIAKTYEIIRNVRSPCSLTVSREPVRVLVLLDEVGFNASGAALKHRETVFFTDKGHDWRLLDEGEIRFSMIKGDVDLLLVYEEEEIPALFCPNCGGRLHPVHQCVCSNSPNALEF